MRFFYVAILSILTLLVSSTSEVNAYYSHMPASVVIGQPDFSSTSANQGGSAAANTLKQPHGLHYDHSSGKLIVADYGNNRVLIYNSLPKSNNASADVVIGQQNFTSGSANQGGAVAANTINQPRDALVVNGKLLISDGANSRILIYNTIPTSNNASADVVIGQQNFTSGSANQGGSRSANTLNIPTGLDSDGTKLYVADSGNTVF